MKNLKISTELASAVLGKEVTKCSLLSTARNSINITYFEDEEDFSTVCKEWNIYEFAFKCKEWAFKEGYMMKIENHYSNIIVVQIRKTISNSTYIEPWKKTFRSEIEAIIKACEWILEQNK